MDLILLGAPGAGKGTQGVMLAQAMGVPKIATGDMLREAVRAGTPLGVAAKQVMDAGQLVSDEIVLGLVREALDREEAKAGAIFDGYPRNATQAQALDGLLAELGRRIDAVVHLVVPEEAIVERMSGRRTDPETQEVYHVVHNPPPPGVAERVVQRADDREETVRERFRVYRAQTEPLLAFYRERGVRIHDVDGDRPIEAVQADLQAIVRP